MPVVREDGAEDGGAPRARGGGARSRDRGIAALVVVILAALGGTWWYVGHEQRRVMLAEARKLSAAGVALYEGSDMWGAEDALGKAIAIFRKAGTLRESEGVRSLQYLGMCAEKRADFVAAAAVYREALELQRGTAAVGWQDAAWTELNLGRALVEQAKQDEAEGLIREAIRQYRANGRGGEQDLAWALQSLGWLERSRGRQAEAEPLYREALSLMPAGQVSDSERLTPMRQLAAVLVHLRRFDEGESLAREALGIARGLAVQEDETLGYCTGTLAWLLKEKGAHAEAEQLYVETIAIRRRSASTELDTDISWALSSYGELLLLEGRVRESEAPLTEALQLRRGLYPEGHPKTATSLRMLAYMKRQAGEYAVAERLSGEALAMCRRALGEAARETAYAKEQRGLALACVGRHEEAVALLREAVETLCAQGGPDDEAGSSARVGLGWALLQKGDLDGAEAELREGIASRRRMNHGGSDLSVGDGLEELGQTLQARGDLEGAERTHLEALAAREEVFGPRHKQVMDSLHNVAYVREARHDVAGALEAHARALSIGREIFGATAPSVLGCTFEVAGLMREAGDGRGAEAMEASAMSAAEALGAKDRGGEAAERVAEGLMTARRAADAEPFFRRALEAERGGQGRPWRLGQLGNDLAWALHEQGSDTAEAEAIAREAVANLSAAGTDALRHASALDTLATILMATGGNEGALEAWGEADAKMSAAGKLDEAWWAGSRSRHGRCLLRAGREEEGAAMVREALAKLEGSPRGDAREIAEARRALEAVAGGSGVGSARE